MRGDRWRGQRVVGELSRRAASGETLADKGLDARAEQSQHELALFLADEPEAGEGRAFMDDAVLHAVVVIKLLQQRCEPLRFAYRRESADTQEMAIAAQLVRLAQCADRIDKVPQRGFGLSQEKGPVKVGKKGR